MFALIESCRSAWESIIAHGFRSILTMLGIIIGVASVIAVISLVQGLRQSIMAEFQGLGTNSFTVRSYTPLEERLKGRQAYLTPRDLQAIQERVDGIVSMTPVLALGGGHLVRYGNTTALSQIQGTTFSYQDVAQNFAEYGRFITAQDDRKRRRVAVLGAKTAKDLGLPENPVGTYIEVGGEWVKVIGLMESRGEILGFSQDEFVLMPYETVRSMNGAQKKPDLFIQLTAADADSLPELTERIARVLRRSHDLSVNQPNDFRIETSEQMAQSFDNIINTVTIIIGGIVGISLLVGGIGIMNIMLVTVTERTREIGICKALGARRSNILAQFLIEALALSLLGGLIGLVLGYGLGALIAALIPDFPPAAVPWWAVVLAIGFSGLIGVVFGILPASKAADLDPIDALRYE
ncbi:MAG: ABC transporter permease [Pseudomonadota bacterium]